ncbi:MAG: hypothetical protein FHP94_05500 [Denitromonas halophila]|nr:MAG: hypothetical protein FHP94_05500 [Denitromonas halophila]
MLLLRSEWSNLQSAVHLREAYWWRCVLARQQISHSEGLLLAASLAAQKAAPDLVEYFCEHAKEEAPHVAWATADLGYMETVTGRDCAVESVRIQHLIERQRVYLESGDVTSFLGYVLALEAFPGSERYWTTYAVRAGLPISCFQNVLGHAFSDVAHSDALRDIVDEISQARMPSLLDSLSLTFTDLSRALTDGMHVIVSAREEQMGDIH